ncbi:MAG: site-specific DNA-methyltransferase [Gammaproteobacteria bacterium AqS3]|nr:site-specific DNA-methyltransferase [Gammaproteobacteria bacterium AqS3]
MTRKQLEKTASKSSKAGSVFSGTREIIAPKIKPPRGCRFNQRLKMEGRTLLGRLPEDSIPAVFFDPQYRGVLDRLQLGNEGRHRERRRAALKAMTDPDIRQFILAIDRVLIPSGHLFLWLDKFHLCNGFRDWIEDSGLDVVDLINWNKGKIGLGYRSRRTTEYCLVLQKAPRKAKGVWINHSIPDTWPEKIASHRGHPHKKPVNLQAALIEAVTQEGDLVVDPAAGDFTVLEAARQTNREFLGCDLNG